MARQIAATRQRTVDALVAERGGLASIDTLTRIRIENFGLACAQFKVLESYIEEFSPLTDAGQRRAANETLMTLSASVERLGSQLRDDASAASTPVEPQRADVKLESLSADQLEEHALSMLASIRALKTPPPARTHC